MIAAVAFGTLQTVLILAILMQRRHRARVQVALAASYTQLRQLTNRLISAQEEERSRIARNLHDDVGQRVASLSIALSALRRKPDTADTVRQELSALQQQTVALSGELRDLSHELHPGILEHLGLVEALRSRCDELENEAGVRVRLDVADDWPKVSDAVAPASIASCRKPFAMSTAMPLRRTWWYPSAAMARTFYCTSPTMAAASTRVRRSRDWGLSASPNG